MNIETGSIETKVKRHVVHNATLTKINKNNDTKNQQWRWRAETYHSKRVGKKGDMGNILKPRQEINKRTQGTQ